MTDPEEPPIDPEEPPVLPPRPDYPDDQTFIIHREPYTDANGVQTWHDTVPMTPETYAELQAQAGQNPDVWTPYYSSPSGSA